MENVKAILFDMDGVLLNSEYAIRQCSIDMLAEYGVNACHDDFIPYTGMGEDRFIGGVAEKYGLAYDKKMKDRTYELYGQHPEWVETFAGIAEFIWELKKTYRLAVASSADEVKVAINLNCIGLSKSDFDAIVTGTQIKRKKPDPEIYLTAASLLNVSPTDCIVVEDAVAGVKAGIAAGAKVIGILGSFSQAELSQAGAQWICKKTTDIKNLL